MMGFDLTDTVAAVAREGVSIITDFTRLIDNAVTATRRRRSLVNARAGSTGRATGSELESGATNVLVTPGGTTSGTIAAH